MKYVSGNKTVRFIAVGMVPNNARKMCLIKGERGREESAGERTEDRSRSSRVEKLRWSAPDSSSLHELAQY